MGREIFAGGALWVSIYATFVLNFCDVTRSSTTRKSIIKGNFWGIPINMLSIPNTAAVISLLIAFIPALEPVSAFSRFVGAGIGAIAYFLLADRSRTFHDFSGEPIAVPSVH